MKRMLCLLIGFLVCPASLVFAKDAHQAVSQGNKLYKEDKLEKALKSYDEGLKLKPDSAIVNFYRGGVFLPYCFFCFLRILFARLPPEPG